MKKITTILCAALVSTQIFATDPALPSACATESYPGTIKVLMQTQENFYTGKDLTGKVKITFSVNADNTINVLDVDSKNVYLENHTLQALKGQKVDGTCSDEGRVYSITVDFIYVV